MADIYIKKFNLVVEINGPTHYIYDHFYTHKTITKSGLFNDMGYNVLFVKYDKWYDVKGDSNKRRHLLDLLEKAIVMNNFY